MSSNLLPLFFSLILASLTLPIQAATETAISSDAFADSIGINIGVISASSPYDTVNDVGSQLKDLGVRHLRVTVKPSFNVNLNLQRVALMAGAKLDFVIGDSVPPNTSDWTSPSNPVPKTNPSGRWYLDKTQSYHTISPDSLLTGTWLRNDYVEPFLQTLENVEGPNEPACHPLPNHGDVMQSYITVFLDSGEIKYWYDSYPGGTKEFQDALYYTLIQKKWDGVSQPKTDPSDPIDMTKVKLIGPAGCANNDSAGPLQGSILDIENIHSYPPCGQNNFDATSGEPGWGLSHGNKLPKSDETPYNFIANADAINTNAASKPLPIYITETGYSTGLKAGDGYPLPVSELTQAKYYPRIFAESIWAELNTSITPASYRIQRTYTWELYDTDTSSVHDVNGTWGLLRTTVNNSTNPPTFTHTPKPAYAAEKNLIALLSEPGANFTPSQLNYSVTGSGDYEIRHILLQKSNHDYYLLLWQEAPVYDTPQNPADPNPVETATVTLPSNNATCVQYSYSIPSFAFTTTTPPHGNTPNSFQVPVTDTVTVLRITGLN